MDDIRRGEIFYIARGGATNGSEQFADRPAVVVSNDENNCSMRNCSKIKTHKTRKCISFSYIVC